MFRITMLLPVVFSLKFDMINNTFAYMRHCPFLTCDIAPYNISIGCHDCQKSILGQSTFVFRLKSTLIHLLNRTLPLPLLPPPQIPSTQLVMLQLLQMPRRRLLSIPSFFILGFYFNFILYFFNSSNLFFFFFCISLTLPNLSQGQMK